MSLDGLRAWIGEVERKLGLRTRVFLVLAAIAIGGAAAGIYLALEAANESVSKDEVQALQERAGAGAVETGGEAAAVSALKAELETLRSQVSELQEKNASPKPKEKGTSSEPRGKGASSRPAGEGAFPQTSGEATPPESEHPASEGQVPSSERSKELAEEGK